MGHALFVFEHLERQHKGLGKREEIDEKMEIWGEAHSSVFVPAQHTVKWGEMKSDTDEFYEMNAKRSHSHEEVEVFVKVIMVQQIGEIVVHSDRSFYQVDVKNRRLHCVSQMQHSLKWWVESERISQWDVRWELTAVITFPSWSAIAASRKASLSSKDLYISREYGWKKRTQMRDLHPDGWYALRRPYLAKNHAAHKLLRGYGGIFILPSRLWRQWNEISPWRRSELKERERLTSRLRFRQLISASSLDISVSVGCFLTICLLLTTGGNGEISNLIPHAWIL